MQGGLIWNIKEGSCVSKTVVPTTATEVCDEEPKLSARTFWKTLRLAKWRTAVLNVAILFKNSQAFILQLITSIV